MLLTITTTHEPAGDLGHLLAKHPERCQTFDLSFGRAHVFYPEVSASRCCMALLLDLDPIGLVRGRKTKGAATLGQYVNDRPYVASSFLSVAIAKVLGSALGGRSTDRPELAKTAIPLEALVAPLPVRGGETMLRELFEPLGYEIEVTRHPLDETFPEWGESAYFTLSLKATVTLSDLLSHLYVLIPVLDHDKHYWVGKAEVEKLLARGAGWLASHPARDEIARRYLYRQPRLAREAVARLVDEDGIDPDETERSQARLEERLEEKLSLDDQRRARVLSVLHEAGARSVIDLGCGEGKLLRILLGDGQFTQITGVDVAPQALEYAERRLRLDQLAPMQRERISLIQGSLTYRDKRFAGFDAACLVEVLEHLDRCRLGQLERVLFEFAKPVTVIVTTPNREYNVLFGGLGADSLRHADHRFEWTRIEFQKWAERVAVEHGYQVRFLPVGEPHAEFGPPTQMGVFWR